MPYAELLSRSNYSFLHGASHPEELVGQAQALGYEALAISDLDGVYGLPKAYWKAKALGFKLIYGAELSMEGGLGLVLLARDKAGWALLCRLLTASHADKPKGSACLDWARFSELVQAGSRAGLLCLPRLAGVAARPDADEGWDCLPRLHDLFAERLLLPLARVLDGQDRWRSETTRAQAQRFGLGVVAVGDVHCHVPQRQRLQDALACVREGCSLPEAGQRLFSNAQRHLQAAAQRQALFSDWPEALQASLDAARSCAFSLDELRYHYPSEWIPNGLSAQQHLQALTQAGAGRRYPHGVPGAVAAQLDHELAMIARLGYADYFLTIEEIVGFARSRGILCQGRGSAANSAVCWCLGITDIDPVAMGLLFERFLSEERAEPPDIDVDFEHERREEVIQHLYERYGRDRAAMVAAVISYRTRSAIADLSKALGRPERAKRSLRDIQLDDHGPQVAGLARELKGFPRHLSIHSGGFVLSDQPLSDLVPVEPARMPGRSIIQWDKYDLDYVGLMKVDVLALGMLSALRRGLDLCGYAGLADLPAEDPATYAMIQRADTVGVFQIESRAQMNMLGRLKPASFYDLVIQVAIVRPGPIVGRMVHPYLRRRRGQEAVDYEHPALRRILGRTLGVPLFQEQVMRMAVELADFSPGKADELRRAIGAWRSDGRLEGLGLELQAGLRRAGLSEGFVERIFQQIKGFADYGFPESHAASFALLSYASSYLKCRHPAEFCCALINSQPLGFYANHSLVDDAKRHGVVVHPLHPNASDWDCRMEDGAVRLGWRVLEGLGQAAAEAIVAQRQARPFASLEDFAKRSGLGSRLLLRLALGHAFDGFGLEPRQALWQLLALRGFRAARGAQLGLWDSLAPASQPAAFAPLNAYEAVAEDYRSYGLSTRAHPMQALRQALRLPKSRAADARTAPHGSWFELAGLLIVRQRPGEGKVVFATLEDESGLLDLVLFMDVYERFRDEFLNHAFFKAAGVLQRDGASSCVLLKQLQALDVEQALKAQAHNWH